MKTTTNTGAATKTSKRGIFAPAKWQWDPSQVCGGQMGGRVQLWSAGGSMTLISVAEAQKLVRLRAAFVGSAIHVCQVHDRIDGVNA